MLFGAFGVGDGHLPGRLGSVVLQSWNQPNRRFRSCQSQGTLKITPADLLGGVRVLGPQSLDQPRHRMRAIGDGIARCQGPVPCLKFQPPEFEKIGEFLKGAAPFSRVSQCTGQKAFLLLKAAFFQLT
jgi:hypothetical protein